MYAFWIETFFVRVSQCGWRDVEQLFGARHCRERMVVAVDKGAYGASGAIGHFMVFYIETSGLGTESVGHRLAFKAGDVTISLTRGSSVWYVSLVQ